MGVKEVWIFTYISPGDIEKLKSHTICNFEYLLSAVQSKSVQHLIQDINHIRTLILDTEMDLIQNTLSLSAQAVDSEPLQLAAELIGRLSPRKGEMTVPFGADRKYEVTFEYPVFYTL